MTRSVARALGLVALSALTAGACSNNSTTSTTPTPTPTSVTETFNGLLSQNGGLVFPFNTGAAGSVSASVTTISPDGSITIGFSLGTWNGTSCAVVIDNPASVLNTVLSGTAGGAGALCARVYDPSGSVPASESVTITITHP